MLKSVSMRAYKFLDAHFGLKSLYEKRLKISRIHELNDPFELTPYDLTKRIEREAFLKFRDDLGHCHGMLCFSGDWSDPVIWAHYSDKHKGMCLSFEVPPMERNPDRDISKFVKYIQEPLRFPAGFHGCCVEEKERIVQTILFTKYKNWEYEKEIRVWARLEDEEDGLYFFDFDATVRLVEVIVGAKCKVPRNAIARALGPLASEVKIMKVRAAYNKFEMVMDE